MAKKAIQELEVILDYFFNYNSFLIVLIPDTIEFSDGYKDEDTEFRYKKINDKERKERLLNFYKSSRFKQACNFKGKESEFWWIDCRELNLMT